MEETPAQEPLSQVITKLSAEQEDILAELITFLHSEDNRIVPGLLDDRGDFERPISPNGMITAFLKSRNTDAPEAIERLAGLDYISQPQ